MGKGEKRSSEQIEGGSSVDVDSYVLSTKERLILEKGTFNRPSFTRCARNLNPNTATKMAAVKADQSIVTLVSFSGELMVTQSCGTIIENFDNVYTVITSLSLVRRPTKSRIMENSFPPNLKVIVHCPDENTYIGEIEAYDFHYNILIIKFKSATSFLTANLKMFDDNVNLERSFQLRPQNDLENSVIVAGRYFNEPFKLMAAPGVFSDDRSEISEYDCDELRSSTCIITRCGDGSPLINLNGEVVGITYYLLAPASPILPIDIAYKWWSHFKTSKESRHPSYGFTASSIYSAPLDTLARFMKKFPGVSNGLLVDAVHPRSNAETAGLLEDDVIVKCDGKSVKSFVEIWNMMWDKVGDVVDLEVARLDDGSTMSISLVVGEATPNKLNKWPRYD